MFLLNLSILWTMFCFQALLGGAMLRAAICAHMLLDKRGLGEERCRILRVPEVSF
jgi:hypothetical protein